MPVRGSLPAESRNHGSGDPDAPENAGDRRAARLQRRLTTASERLATTVDTARGRSRTVDATVRAYERDREAVGAVLAGAVAFRLFIFLLPLTLTVVTLLGAAEALHRGAAADVGRELGMGTYLIDSVEGAAAQSRRSLWALVPLALFAVYTGGVAITKVLAAVHAIAWGRRPAKLRNSLLAALAALGLAVATVALTAGTQALRHRSGGLGLTLSVLEFLPFSALWLLASSRLPHDPRARWTAHVPGAVLVGLAVWGAHLVSVYYLARRVQKASELYGSLGVAAAILAWLFLLSRVMVASAMLNATLWERRHQVEGAPPSRVASG